MVVSGVLVEMPLARIMVLLVPCLLILAHVVITPIVVLV
jgi:uncharacterized membrane protein